MECISPTSVVKIFDSKYTFNDKSVYEDVSYGLTTTTSYVLQDIPSDHPIALLNNVITQVTYSPVDDTPIIIKVSGGNTTTTNSDYFTFTDVNDNAINIGNGTFKFMRGRTYKFEANGITGHSFKVYMSGGFQVDNNGANTGITGTVDSITITIPSNHSTGGGDLYYECHNHSAMKADLALTYGTAPNTDGNSYDFYYGNVNVGVSGQFTGALSVACLYHGYMGGQDLIVYKASCTAPTSAYA